VYLTAQQLAIANQAVVETFETTSIAWQAIPHWNVGDPGQSRVRNDVVNNPGFLNLELNQIPFQLTLVQTSAPSTDSLVAEATWYATELAREFDLYVLFWLFAFAWNNKKIDFYETVQNVLLQNLIEARASVEDAGYRAPSCLITGTQGLKSLSSLASGYPIVESLLEAAHVNSLHRTSLYTNVTNATDKKGNPPTDSGGTVIVDPQPRTIMVMLGRRQLIAHGAAMDSSPGEEPVDLAVSVSPSLEIVGEAPGSLIELSVRIRYALRIKDPKSLVLLWGTPVYVP
jgi:hypothetical protein